MVRGAWKQRGAIMGDLKKDIETLMNVPVATQADKQGSDVIRHLYEIAYRDSAVSVTVRTEDLRGLLDHVAWSGKQVGLTADERQAIERAIEMLDWHRAPEKFLDRLRAILARFGSPPAEQNDLKVGDRVRFNNPHLRDRHNLEGVVVGVEGMSVEIKFDRYPYHNETYVQTVLEKK